MTDTIIVSGADSRAYPNLCVLVGSWLTHMRHVPLIVCDFGLDAAYVSELTRCGVHVVRCEFPLSHPWQGKSLIGRYLRQFTGTWDIVLWIDADALFASSLPPLLPLLDGYDMIIDAHVQCVGEIVHDCNRVALGLRSDDAYFSAGCWIARRGVLMETYERFTAMVMGKGNLWECDAFVAAIYAEKLKLRTVHGGIWHARGKTSLFTCSVQGLQPYHADMPILILHANDGYDERPDGRRILKRPELAAIQDYYDAVFAAARAANS